MDWRSTTFFLLEENTYVDGNFVVTQDQMIENFEGFLAAWQDQGLNSVSLTWFVPVDPLSGEILDAYGPDVPSFFRGLPDADKLAAFTDAAHAAGMSVSWKTNFVPNTATSGNVNDFFTPDIDVANFLAEVETYWTDLSALAQANDVEMVIIGGEQGRYAGPEWEAEWRDIIAAIRANYSGLMTYDGLGYVDRPVYAADDVSFWDALDFIGISMYLPMGLDDTPTMEEAYDLMSANPVVSWQPTPAVDLPAYLEGLSQTWGKDILFTEIGINSADGALLDPTVSSGIADFFEQAILYGVHLDTWTQYDWVAGMNWWNNAAELASPPGSDGWDSWYSGTESLFTFLGKTAGDVLRAFWAHDNAGLPITGDVVLGDIGDDSIDGGALGEVIAGSLGNDTLRGNAGADRLIGGAGFDLLFGGTGDDLLDGEGSGPSDGDDTLIGGSGNDRLFGGPGADFLAGDDVDPSWTVDYPFLSADVFEL